MASTRSSFGAPVVGVSLLDLAVQAVHVTDQTLIHAPHPHPDAGSRLIGAYMVCHARGSAAGAIAATSLHAVAGRCAVCVLGAAFGCLGLVPWAFSRDDTTGACVPQRLSTLG